MSRQTTIQELEAIRKGSVRVLVGDNFSSLVDIGALRNPVFTSLVENQEIVFDNVASLKKYVNGEKVQFAFDLCEINLSNIAKLDAGLMSLSTVAATLVEDAEQLIVAGDWEYNKFIKIENQNGDGDAITVVSVTGATDGVLAAEDDYYVGQNEAGEYGIFIKNTTAVTTLNQNVTIVYDYTPNASKKIEFNSSGNKTLKVLRIINTDENNKTFKIDIENGTNMTPISIDFAGDEEEEVAVLPIQFEGELVEIVDEQQA